MFGFPPGLPGGNHFLVMTSLWVGDFRINALIAHRRWRDYALVLGRWRGLLFLVGSGWVFALRNGLVPRFAHVGTRRGIGGTCQQDQHQACIPRRILHGRHAQQFYARLELPLASRRLTIPKHSTVTMPCFAAEDQRRAPNQIHCARHMQVMPGALPRGQPQSSAL